MRKFKINSRVGVTLERV